MADLDKIVKDLSSLTVIEAAELSKLLEEKWGVSAAAPVAVAAASAATSDEAAEEKSEFEVVLKEIGTNKIAVIKEVRTIVNESFSSAASPPASPPGAAAATATGAAAETPHFSSRIFDNSEASRTVKFDNSSAIFSKSAIFFLLIS